jgi:hypothetical protein
MSKPLKIMLISIAGLLLIPFIAMQFSDEVSWSAFDFILAVALLFSTAFICNWVWSKVKNTKTKFVLCAVVLFVLILVWAEMAVGIFNSPISGN